MSRLSNKVIIITGGASGIGEATCRLLAKEGAQIALLDINREKGQHIIDDIHAQGGQAAFWSMNASLEKEVQTVIAEVIQKWGRINVLVNNVGIIGDNKPTHEISEAEWDKVMNINVKSVLFCTKYVVPYLQKAGGGSIINISSVHGLIGTPDYPANHASKAAVRLMTKTDAMLYAKDNIRVNSIHPGYIWTPLLEEIARKSALGYEAFRTQHEKIQPLGYMGQPNDVAYAIAYLASDESRFMTASELVIDGGLSGGQLVNSI
ncbi:SDR family NAD(P)-dependent oxidoreductase [Legionella brunensis]|uniref:Acetyoacetyl CoA reductase n=1 Tax=Legionella brunensis TaxID=29422 RepID=A0A0W0S2Z7_9GAMM|nr:glucose 1-dehydrogenase [Legionella brunensis]KTC77846.1 acetyoacetyl CoA reductase [Legionella brunensis]